MKALPSFSLPTFVSDKYSQPLQMGVKAALPFVMMLALAISSKAAHGQSDGTTFNVERFRLSSDRNGILDVESANVLPHLSLDAGFWVGYADDPLTLYRTVNGERNREGALVGDRLGSGVVLAFSLFNRFQIGLELPVILNQSEDIEGIVDAPAGISATGLGDLRLLPKIQLLHNEKHGVDLAFAIGLVLPTGTSDDYFGDERIMFQPELLLSVPFTDKFRAGVNVGYRNRKQQQILNLEVRDELYGHIGVGYRPISLLEVDATFAVATAAESPFGEFNETYGEAKAGLALHLGPVVAFAAGGLGVLEGFGSPDWRVLGGMRVGWIRDDRAPAPRLAVADEDYDGDGMVGAADRCPRDPETVNNWQDDDGCSDSIPDTDGDGVDDVADQCADSAEDMDTFQDEDGCPDLDNDGDGIMDAADKCPMQAGPMENIGCPDADGDGDGVVDRLDNCPAEVGTQENAGCKAEQKVRIANGKLELLDNVFFRTSKAKIQRRSNALLKNIARVLQSHPEITSIHVEGHTDSQGNDEKNKSLSQRRAQAVLDYLVKEGVDASRMKALGYGEERPIADNSTKDGRATNRRVEFKIIGPDDSGVQTRDPSTDAAMEQQGAPNESTK